MHAAVGVPAKTPPMLTPLTLPSSATVTFRSAEPLDWNWRGPSLALRCTAFLAGLGLARRARRGGGSRRAPPSRTDRPGAAGARPRPGRARGEPGAAGTGCARRTGWAAVPDRAARRRRGDDG